LRSRGSKKGTPSPDDTKLGKTREVEQMEDREPERVGPVRKKEKKVKR
jgi:hypothetical protein